MNQKLILFIHGLGGSEETWGNFEKLIKEDESFKDFDVKFFTYRTSITDISLMINQNLSIIQI